MWHTAFVTACAVLLAVIGYQFGYTIHASVAAALVPAVAGGLGGFGIGFASIDVWRRWFRISS